MAAKSAMDGFVWGESSSRSAICRLIMLHVHVDLLGTVSP